MNSDLGLHAVLLATFRRKLQSGCEMLRLIERADQERAARAGVERQINRLYSLLMPGYEQAFPEFDEVVG